MDSNSVWQEKRQQDKIARAVKGTGCSIKESEDEFYAKISSKVY